MTLPNTVVPTPAAHGAGNAKTPPDVAVLLVDGVEDSLVALRALLERDGVRLVTARSGAEALAVLPAHDVALALVDVSMPGMDGVELAERMRGTARTRTVPIIFMTGLTGEPVRAFRGYESGAVDVLVKPVEPRLLRSKVDTFVELHRQRHQLAEMLRISETFVAVLGHDLRSPLQSVELGAQVILQQPEDGAAVQRMARVMQNASRRMVRLIEQLLDFARARLPGGIPILATPCDLGELARATIGQLEPAVAARVELRIAGDQLGTWDSDRIAQVLSHLIGNAAQHGEPDTPIVIAIDGDAERARIEIRNRGEISPAVLPTLFEPFPGAENARRQSAGLGLGLFVVDQIIRGHGGSVRAESGAAGTSVHIELPRQGAPVA